MNDPTIATPGVATRVPLPAAVAPLFHERFVDSCSLLEEYVGRCVEGLARDWGLVEAAATAGDAEELAGRLGFASERAAAVLPWMLALLHRRGHLRRSGEEGGLRYLRAEVPPANGGLDEILDRQRRLDATALPAYDLADRAAASYPEFLSGGRRGEELLFEDSGLETWLRYFSPDNPLYAVSNHIGALAVETWLPRPSGRWLEIGGGAGSGALSLIASLRGNGGWEGLEAYRFTELVPVLLGRGRRALLAATGGDHRLEFGRLDMDRPFAEQGIEPASSALVYGVNTLHVAHDLAFSLAEIRRTLAPGGWLVVSECLRPWPGFPVYTEFAFLLLEAYRNPRLDPEMRPTFGFLTPEAWLRALDTAGFEDLRMLPDVPQLRESYPSLVIGALGGRRPS